MPQATDQTQWTYEDALSWIAGNFRWPGGVIRPRRGYVPTDLDKEAVAFLVLTKGFSYEGEST